MPKITEKKVWAVLAKVLDPELNIPITEMGLIYKIGLKNNGVKITMTLTTPGCPLFDLIEAEIKGRLKKLGFKEKDIALKLTFDPPWDMNKMSKRGKAMLGI